jgi:preprotein translocase subunit SecG
MTFLTILEYLLLVVLLIAAVFIVVAVVFQKTGEDGLSSTLAGGTETYYGKDKSAHTEHVLYKWTLIAGIVFAVATLLVFIIQPDYSASIGLDAWKDDFSSIFQ